MVGVQEQKTVMHVEQNKIFGVKWLGFKGGQPSCRASAQLEGICHLNFRDDDTQLSCSVQHCVAGIAGIKQEDAEVISPMTWNISNCLCFDNKIQDALWLSINGITFKMLCHPHKQKQKGCPFMELLKLETCSSWWHAMPDTHKSDQLVVHSPFQ